MSVFLGIVASLLFIAAIALGLYTFLDVRFTLIVVPIAVGVAFLVAGAVTGWRRRTN
jgi:uncharacterized membrane protein HdeD (DUF308 family)